MKQSLLMFVVIVSLAAFAIGVWPGTPRDADAHCQVPCGIYDDPARIAALREDAATIAKAITNINELAGKQDGQSMNQLVRWVNTKEEHASHIIKVVSEYFLTQKVKPVAPGADGYEAYLKKLAVHHAVMSAAMKCKQSADAATVTALLAKIDALGTCYPKQVNIEVEIQAVPVKLDGHKHHDHDGHDHKHDHKDHQH